MSMGREKTAAPPKYTERDYIRAEPLLMELHKHRKILTRQQSQTIKGQALSGDMDGARRGMEALLEKARKEKAHGRAEKPRDSRLASLLQ